MKIKNDLYIWSLAIFGLPVMVSFPLIIHWIRSSYHEKQAKLLVQNRPELEPRFVSLGTNWAINNDYYPAHISWHYDSSFVDIVPSDKSPVVLICSLTDQKCNLR